MSSTEETVRFTSAAVSLAGTFAVPEPRGPVPAVLMLPGSGQTDRDDNSKRLAINLFPSLAEMLARSGFATLRYDKRGVGASAGDYWSAGFDDRLMDAVAALGWLGDRPEVDSDRIYVLGHSEGALLSIRLAAGSAPVAGAVLLACSAKSGEETLLWQGRQVAKTITGFNRWIINTLHIDPVKSQQKNIDRIKATTADTTRIQLVMKINARWMREFLVYDPAADLASIHQPVLAITGSKDIQVDPTDLERMAELVPGPFTSHVVPDVTHLLRVDLCAPSLRTYKKQGKEPVDSRVVDYVRQWLTEQAYGPA